MATARPVIDHPRFTVRDSNDNKTVCHLRVFDRTRMRNFTAGDVPRVAVVTELDDNPGMSVTNNAENLHAAIAKLLGHTGFLMIEHYPHSTALAGFSAVTVRNGRASWSFLTTPQVEANIGGQLPRGLPSNYERAIAEAAARLSLHEQTDEDMLLIYGSTRPNPEQVTRGYDALVAAGYLEEGPTEFTSLAPQERELARSMYRENRTIHGQGHMQAVAEVYQDFADAAAYQPDTEV